MKILHLTPFLQGGAGRVVTDLAIEQQRAGHHVRVVASETGPSGHGNYGGYLDELTASGVGVRLVDSMFQRQHAPNLRAVRALLDWYTPGREPDVLHAHGAVAAMVALLFTGARRLSAPILQTMHGWGQVSSGDQVATDVAVLDLMDRVAVPSRHAVDTLVSLGVSPARIALIPYGVRSEGPPPDDRDAELIVEMTRLRRSGTLVVACVGTVGTRRNQTLLVEALARRPDLPVFCVFVGDGTTDVLLAAAAEAGVEKRVCVHGYSPAARRIAAASDLLVLPSRSEGLPVSVLEAFCDGTLVAVSDIPELTDLVDDDVGFRFAANNADQLATLLERISSLPNVVRRSTREHARLRYQQRFMLETMTREYFGLYAAIDRRAAGTRVRAASRRAGRESSVA